jgi:hypothetical protein
MKKGDIFFDYRLKNAGRIEVWPSSLGIQTYDVVDLSINNNQYNTIRLNFAVSGFGALQTDSIVALRLHHGDDELPTTPVAKNDVIGPVDNNGKPTIGPDGEWKRLQTWDGIDVQNMGYRIYSVGYIGLKKYVQLSHDIIQSPPVGTVVSFCTIIVANIHVGKCYDYYGLLGIDGGQ